MEKKVLTEHENKMINKVFLRSHLVFWNASYINMEGNGYTYSLAPVIEEIYAGDEEGRKEAYQRHTQFFNTHAVPFSFCVGLSWAMEKEHAEKGEAAMPASSINALKSALMGPTAGMFDNFFFNCVRIIAAGIGINLCEQGNFLGVILFILIYGIPQSVCKYLFVKYGYVYGTELINMLFESGLMQSFTKAASLVGIMIVGAMSAGFVNVPLNMVLDLNGATVNIGDVLNSIFPGLLSVLLVFGYVALIKKGWKPLRLVLVTLVIGIVGALIHIF